MQRRRTGRGELESPFGPWESLCAMVRLFWGMAGVAGLLHERFCGGSSAGAGALVVPLGDRRGANWAPE